MSDWPSHVLPHGPLRQLAPKLWEVTGRLARGPMPRNMTVFRLPSGGLWIHSAIALSEPAMAELERLGQPEVLVVPNGFHRLDAAVWKERYPRLLVVAPRGARTKVEQKVAVDGTSEELLPKFGITPQAPGGVKPLELVYELEVGEGRRALVFTDLLMNLPRLPGFGGWLLGLLGSTGFFGMTRVGRLLLLQDKSLFKSWLEDQARRTDLAVLTVAHGEAVTRDCQGRLREAARRL